jgi:hypothetical protein
MFMMKGDIDEIPRGKRQRESGVEGAYCFMG